MTIFRLIHTFLQVTAFTKNTVIAAIIVKLKVPKRYAENEETSVQRRVQPVSKLYRMRSLNNWYSF